MAKERPNRYQTEAKINARAWKDPAFKKKLLSNPQYALKEMGMDNLPASLRIQVVEEGKEQWYIVLHAPPANANQMSEADLERIAAAGLGHVDLPGCAGGHSHT